MFLSLVLVVKALAVSCFLVRSGGFVLVLSKSLCLLAWYDVIGLHAMLASIDRNVTK